MNDTINRYLGILFYPVVSHQCFCDDILETYILETNRNGFRSKESIKIATLLKDSVIDYMRTHYTIYSCDELYLYLEKCYLYRVKTEKYKSVHQLYIQIFMGIVKSMISQRDGRIVFKYWENENDKSFLGGFGGQNKIFLFHSINMHIPLDFMVMLYILQNDKNTVECLDHYYNQIEVADQQLSGILKKGVAENHLHNGVSLSFSEIWDGFMVPFDSRAVKEAQTINFRIWNKELVQEEVLFQVYAAGVMRVLLAFNVCGSSIESFDPELKSLYQSFLSGKALHRKYISDICKGEEKTDEIRTDIITYFHKLWDTIRDLLPHTDEGSSMIRQVFQAPGFDSLHTSDENILLFYLMKYYKSHCESQEGRVREIMRGILQYLRVKNFLFGLSVQKKTIHGLDYFQSEFYKKNSDFNQLAIKRMGYQSHWEIALRKQFQNKDLKTIEFRCSIGNKERYLRKGLKEFLCAYQKIIKEDYCRLVDGEYKVMKTFPKIGLVFHLLKRHDFLIPEKCLLDGLSDKDKMLYGTLETEYMSQLDMMCELRDTIPGLDQYIVGLDAASLENATPVWVFVNAYERARDSVKERVGYQSGAAGTGIQSLRFTFHAGEDFRHILSGIRRIDEAVRFLKFHAGDRIGHGTALGLEAEQWRKSNPFIVIPRMEALENYIWSYYLLSQDSSNFQSTIMAYIERRTYELARDIFGEAQGISMTALMESYVRMFSLTLEEHYRKCERAKETGFCYHVQGGGCDDIVWNSEKLVMARHCRRFLKKMEEPINHQVTDQDMVLVHALQKIVRKKMSIEGIVVEVNPSSNVSIGEIDRITENQIFKLNARNQEHNVMVCVNSDDPTVFNTNVSNELAYIYYGLLHEQMSREDALEWIDKIRAYGINASFIRFEESDQQVFDNLNQIIDKM